jgi:hypothetical protein
MRIYCKFEKYEAHFSKGPVVAGTIMRKQIKIEGITFITSFCLLHLLFLGGCNSESINKYQSEIETIASKWIPDEREAICNIEALPAGRNRIILTGETTIPQIKNEILNTLGNSGILLTDSIILLPDTTLNKEYYGIVTISTANLRKEPHQSAELVSQAILGTPLLILKHQNSWLLVQTPDRYISWTEASSVVPLNRLEFSAWKKADKIIYTENSGWVYGTSDETTVAGDLVSGAILKRRGESGNYITVAFPDGREGLVRKNAAKDYMLWRNESIVSCENLTSTALTFLGLPYLWGGTSSKAVDCSGFMQCVFFRNGLILSRDASLQAGHGAVIDISHDYSALTCGDLLFFGSRNETGNHVTHVALYIGNSEFIHASFRVMINSLDSTKSNFSRFRQKSLLSAKRILGTENDPGIVHVSKHEWY